MNWYKVNAMRWIALSLVLLVLTACASLPRPRSPESTLLIVQTTRQRTQELGLEFWLHMDDGTRHMLDFTRSENLTFIRDIDPGIARSKMLRVSFKHGTTSASGGRYLDYPLRIETTLTPGAYTIFPATIVYRETMTREGHYEFSIDFMKIDAAGTRGILSTLEGMGISEHWSKSD